VSFDTTLNLTKDIGREAAEAYLASKAMLNVRGANVQIAAAHNRKIILQSLRTLKTAERSDLADITGLTTPAIFKIVRELLDEGLVISPKTRRGAKGQPAAVLAINPDAAFSVGISLEQDHTVLIVMDFAGDVRGRRSLAGTHPGAAAAPRGFYADHIARLLDDHAVDVAKIVGIGIATGDARTFPALADIGSTSGARFHFAGREFAGLAGRPLYVEDRAIAAAHAEALLSQSSASEPFFYLHLSDHLGSALVVDGHVMRGNLNRRNAPAALPQLNPFRSSRTDLGKRLGETVSLPAFLQFLADRGQTMSTLDDIDLTDKSVDETVDEWIGVVADLLYVPLLSMFCCLNLGSILIGGPFPREIIARLCLGLNTRLSLNLGLNWSEMAVKPTTLGGLAPALGAALLAFDDKW